MEEAFQVLNDHQDWKPIIIRKNNENKKESSSKSVNYEQQKNKKIEKQIEEGNMKHKKIPDDIRKKIQQKRGELNMTQKQLAQKINIQVSIINEIETGKALYNHKHINKIKRILNI